LHKFFVQPQTLHDDICLRALSIYIFVGILDAQI